jgi:hypothetical protein
VNEVRTRGEQKKGEAFSVGYAEGKPGRPKYPREQRLCLGGKLQDKEYSFPDGRKSLKRRFNSE